LIWGFNWASEVDDTSNYYAAENRERVDESASSMASAMEEA
jgi:hypothetical protein